MTDLIQRIEQAKEPRRELFEEAYDCLPHAWQGANNCARFNAMLDAQAWTSAAEMLVPEGASYDVRWRSGDQSYWVTYYPPGDAEDDYLHVWEAVHPSLGLLEAILRAERKGDE